nr:MAG TPA: hypothetical protein [Caudoviricetes sp.]
MFEWKLVNSQFITYSPSNGWNFNLSITKVNREHDINFNSISFEGIAADDPAVEVGRIVNTYTVVVPVMSLQKAISKASSIEHISLKFHFSFGIGASVSDNICYADGIIFIKLDEVNKNLSVIDGSIYGTIETNTGTLQQTFLYNVTTETNTTTYNDIPIKPEYIFRKSYGTKCWFDLKLPAVIDPNTYPPVNKSINVYTNVTGSISATILSISSDFTTLTCVVDFTSNKKNVLIIKTVPYLVSDQVDDTSPVVLQTNIDKTYGILYKSNNTIQATEFIESDSGNILLQTGNRIWAKEFIENNSSIITKNDYSIIATEFVEV